MGELLWKVLVDEGCMHFPRLIATDNAGKDQHTMSDTMHEIRAELVSKGSIPACTPETVVVQDVWHARQRIGVLLNRNHPDYFSALTDLKVVFARYVKLLVQPS